MTQEWQAQYSLTVTKSIANWWNNFHCAKVMWFLSEEIIDYDGTSFSTLTEHRKHTLNVFITELHQQMGLFVRNRISIYELSIRLQFTATLNGQLYGYISKKTSLSHYCKLPLSLPIAPRYGDNRPLRQYSPYISPDTTVSYHSYFSWSLEVMKT